VVPVICQEEIWSPWSWPPDRIEQIFLFSKLVERLSRGRGTSTEMRPIISANGRKSPHSGPRLPSASRPTWRIRLANLWWGPVVRKSPRKLAARRHRRRPLSTRLLAHRRRRLLRLSAAEVPLPSSDPRKQTVSRRAQRHEINLVALCGPHRAVFRPNGVFWSFFFPSGPPLPRPTPTFIMPAEDGMYFAVTGIHFSAKNSCREIDQHQRGALGDGLGLTELIGKKSPLPTAPSNLRAGSNSRSVFGFKPKSI